jgi:hypothetical protein
MTMQTSLSYCLRTGVTAIAVLVGANSVSAQMHNHQPKQETCTEQILSCASKATPFFAPDGTLWTVLATQDRTYVVHSSDEGRTFSAPIAVHSEPMSLDWGPDARPQIAVNKSGDVFVAFNIFRDKAFNGQIFYTRSTDGGRSFAPEKPITSNLESQRFQAIALDNDGALFAAWLDKRNRVPAAEKGEKYVGAALAFAWSRDSAQTFSETRIAQDNTCECCRLGVGFAGPGRPVVVFRNAFDKTTRDHAVITFADPATPGPVYRVSYDNWKTDACPHHGPSLSIAKSGTYHIVWYTNGEARRGLFYARSTNGGQGFSTPMALAPGRSASRPFVLAVSDTVWLVWKEFDGDETKVMAMTSRNDGQSWSTPTTIARTGEDSDHPLLVAKGDAVFLSWITRKDGYRFIKLETRS